MEGSGFCCGYEVRPSPGKGLGAFATEPVPNGHLVWRFTPGRFIVHDEASFRALVGSLAHADAVYEFTHTFGLADFPECVIRVLDDGGRINHAAKPTLATNFGLPMRATLDPSSPAYLKQVAAALLEDRFALIAIYDIGSGEEFTNNYDEEECNPPFYQRLYEAYGVVEHYF